MEQSSISRKREIITALAVLIVIVVIVGGVTIANKKKSSPSAMTSTNTTANTPSTNPPAGAPSAATYKDGTYTAIGSYNSPGGQEQITVDVTLANDVVTATSAKSGAGDPEASEYQDQFISGYKQFVVGKDVSSLRLSRVSGSSLTSQGFNNALEQIKQQAQA